MQAGKLERCALVQAVHQIERLHRLASRADLQIEILLAPADVIEQTRENHYGLVAGNRSVTQLIDKVVDEIGPLPGLEEGADEAEAQRRAQDAGIVNLVDRIMLSATGALEIGDLPAGRISVVSQSGGILGALGLPTPQPTAPPTQGASEEWYQVYFTSPRYPDRESDQREHERGRQRGRRPQPRRPPPS